MRWADLDLHEHVSNVVYVDYLQEARVDMLRAHGRSGEQEQGAELSEGAVVVRHEVTYLAPLLFRFRTVQIECWVTEIRAASFTMAYEVFEEDEEGRRRVYVRASTVLTPYVFATERPRRISPEERDSLTRFLEPAAPTERTARPRPQIPREPAGRYAVNVRFSDVDVYGHVNNVKYFEYFQEARIRLHARLFPGLEEIPALHLVVAQTEVDYRAPIVFRAEPYDCWSHVSRVGKRSLTIASEICDGDVVLSRAKVAMVFLDGRTRRATEPPYAYLTPLVAAVSGE